MKPENEKDSYKRDCFGFMGTKCSALKVLDCRRCAFYKKRRDITAAAKNGRKRTTDYDRKYIRELRKQGMTVLDISRETGWSTGTVNNILRKK